MDSYGYVNLFPLLLQVLPPSSDKLGHLFSQLKNTSVRNTRHDVPFFVDTETDTLEPGLASDWTLVM